MLQVGGVNLDGIPLATRSLTAVCARRGAALMIPTTVMAVPILVLTIKTPYSGSPIQRFGCSPDGEREIASPLPPRGPVCQFGGPARQRPHIRLSLSDHLARPGPSRGQLNHPAWRPQLHVGPMSPAQQYIAVFPPWCCDGRTLPRRHEPAPAQQSLRPGIPP